MVTIPKWVKPERQAYLVDLFNQNNGFCVYGHNPCKGEWVTSSKVVCYWGKTCNKPNENGYCTKRPEDNKPILPCQILHLNISRWHCAYASHACYKPFESHYSHLETSLIKEWVNDDRQDRLGLERAESVASHKTNDRQYPLRGEFSAVSKDVYFNNQPEYFIETLGFSGLTFKPFARVRLASSPVRLYVNIDDMLKPLSKNARRKAIRYGLIPKRLADRIDIACYKAVAHFKAIK